MRTVIFVMVAMCMNVALAAIPATTQWEIRQNSGNALNGCGYVPGSAGTDFSQQANSQYNGTNLASTNGSTNPCVVTSATHNFVTADEGNIIRISAGTNWTTGSYHIVSTSGNAATLDRACGSAASISGGTFRVGGACGDTFQVGTGPVAGNTFWIRAGNYNTATCSSVPVSGTLGSPVKYIGYNTVRGDNPTGTNRPLFTCNASAFNTLSDNYVANLSFISTTTPVEVVRVGARTRVYNVKAENPSTTTARFAFQVRGADAQLINCEAISYRGIAVGFSGVFPAFFYGNYIHDSNIGISSPSTTSPITIVNNIISDNVSNGITSTAATTAQVLIYGNTLYGAENQQGIGVNIVGAANSVQRIFNNIIYGFTTGVSAANQNPTEQGGGWNTFFNNGTNATNWTLSTGDITLDPQFANMAQYTGTTATTSGAVLTDGSANFTQLVNGVSFCRIVSGTGVTAGKYKVTSFTTTTATLSPSPGTNATADKVYQCTYGHNFSVGSNMKAKGFPGLIYGVGSTGGTGQIGYLDIGAIQREEPAGGGGGGFDKGKVINRK